MYVMPQNASRENDAGYCDIIQASIQFQNSLQLN